MTLLAHGHTWETTATQTIVTGRVRIALACRQLKMTPAEAINAATINAAYAMDRGEKVGSIEVGKRADIIVLDIPNHQ